MFPRHDPPLKRWAIFEDVADRRRFPGMQGEAWHSRFMGIKNVVNQEPVIILI
jgi:hypothetical protein